MREGHLRSLNKTLKEEVRKLAKTEARDRAGGRSPVVTPGGSDKEEASGKARGAQVDSKGKWDMMNGTGTPPRSSSIQGASSTLSSNGSVPMSPTGTEEPMGAQEVSVNLEYLRNILVKFVEFKAQRPQLIVVLATLLKIPSEDVKRMVQQLS